MNVFRTRPRSGLILLMTLLALGLLVFLGTLFLDLYRSSQNTTLEMTNRIVASAAAEGALNDARLQIKTDPAWTAGFTQEPLPNGATYTCTFDPAAGMPYSTNNGAGTTVVLGYKGLKVPPGMVHVVAVAAYGRETMQAEELVSASDGSLVYRW